MKTRKINIIEALFAIKFDKELQAILKRDIKAIKSSISSAVNPNQIAV
ncbi:hypothetical protein [Mucilaginibacter paludis]|uniref:Uncharacterized protein n=1 Tax=Mucilaginibacter paludis DSM 18603 TaxID=714943 RepID=H1Y6Y5_9SPHI|nr:hypothetical protein [Mucilaginibacter paludis]EHQ28392.1 hypothetical protein Mucpa_4302 [Mucilaginibacter paludis DSM 18603]